MNYYSKHLSIVFILFVFSLIYIGCEKREKNLAAEKNLPQTEKQNLKKESSSIKTNEKKLVKKSDIRVTFIELGSVKCIPCKMMQPIMKEIEDEYRDQVKVIFYDVWTVDGRKYGQQYRIRVIPTQVFLDNNGKEYFRHEGFFPKEELVKVLKMKGVE